jgi:hypothetical protein
VTERDTQPKFQICYLFADRGLGGSELDLGQGVTAALRHSPKSSDELEVEIRNLAGKQSNRQSHIRVPQSAKK